MNKIIKKIKTSFLLTTAALAIGLSSSSIADNSVTEVDYSAEVLVGFYSADPAPGTIASIDKTVSNGLDQAIASIPDGQTKENVKAILNNEPTGIAYGFVQQMLGGWVTQLFDSKSTEKVTEATTLTRVAGMTNVLALIMGIVIIGYVMLAGVLNTAASGEVLGKSWSSLWLPIRTALAFGLIMPMGDSGNKEVMASGYLSPVQTGVVYLALVGSNAGDMVWAEAVDSITGGTPVVMPPPNQSLNAVSKISNMAICGYLSSKSKQDYFDEEGEEYSSVDARLMKITYADGVNKFIPYYKAVEGVAGGSQKTGMFNDTKEQLISRAENIGIESIYFGIPNGWMGLDGTCGEINIGANYNKDSNATKSGLIMNYKNIEGSVEKAVSKSIINFIFDLGPIAEKIVQETSTGGLSGVDNLEIALNTLGDSDTKEIRENLDKISIEYASAVRDFSGDLKESTSDAIDKNKEATQSFNELLKRGGWASAGLWYFQLSRFTHVAQEVHRKAFSGIEESDPGTDAANVCPSKGFFTKLFTWSWGDEEENQCIDQTTNSRYVMGVIHNNMLSQIDEKLVLANEDVFDSATVQGDNWDFSTSIASTVLNGGAITGQVFSSGSGVGGGGFGDDVDTQDGSGAQNPFLVLTSIGHALNAITQLVAVAYLATQIADLVGASSGIGGALAKTGAALSGNGSGKMEKGGIMIGMLASILMSLLIGQGYILAYGIPFIPVMIWTMLVIGWLVMIIEAIVAAPLAVILMATPEGQGIAGSRMERAISLLSAVIMRPALSIIGLIASITIAYLGFAIWNQFFWRTAEMIGGIGMIEILAIISMYVVGAITITRYSFNLIHELPNNILQWMNGTSRAFGEQEGASMAQNAADKAGAATGGALQSGAGYMKDARSRKHQANTEKMADNLDKKDGQAQADNKGK